MVIDLLYFAGCPSWQDGLENLKTALAHEKIDAHIRVVQIETNEDAARLRFLGSPSFQVHGVDLWQDERATYVLICRVYSTPPGMRGVPTVEMLRQKLHVYAKINPQ